jgi:hypothetical protein
VVGGDDYKRALAFLATEEAGVIPVRAENLNPEVMVMKSAQDSA